MKRLALAALAIVALAGAASAGGPGSAPEPEGLWTGPIPGYTPSTLKGASVIDVAAAGALVDKGGAVFIDVTEPDRKPPTLPPSVIWRPQHRSIPGAIWFPGAARGDLPTDQEQALKGRVEALTGGDKSKPVVAFCHPDCWGSWNMGKRLVTWGYTKVSWFPDGVDGWQRADRDTAVVPADPDWAAATSFKPEG